MLMSRFSSKAAVCLLLQPGGFEGFLPGRKCLPAHDLAGLRGPEVPDVPAGLDATLLAAFSQGHFGEHVIACFGQLVDFNAGILWVSASSGAA
jgi:hypothetical protein